MRLEDAGFVLQTSSRRPHDVAEARHHAADISRVFSGGLGNLLRVDATAISHTTVNHWMTRSV